MSLFMLLYFAVGFIFTAIGSLIETFELYPTLSEHRGAKVKAAYLLKTRDKYWSEYYEICKKNNKSLIFYQYMKYYDKVAKYYIAVFICIVFLQILFIF